MTANQPTYNQPTKHVLGNFRTEVQTKQIPKQEVEKGIRTQTHTQKGNFQTNSEFQNRSSTRNEIQIRSARLSKQEGEK